MPGDGGAACRVSQDAAVVQPAAAQPRRGGLGPDPDDEGVAGDAPPVIELDLVEGVAPVEAGDACREQDLDALLPVQLGEPSAELLSEDDGQGRRGGLDDRDLGAQTTRGRRDLLTDEPGAHDHHACTRAQRVTQPAGVGERAQLVDVGVVLGAGQPARGAAGGDEQLFVPEPCAIAQDDVAALGVEAPPRRRRGPARRRGRRTTGRGGTAASNGRARRRGTPWTTAGGRRARRAPPTPSAAVRHTRCGEASRRPVALQAQRRRSRRLLTGGTGVGSGSWPVTMLRAGEVGVRPWSEVSYLRAADR